MCAGHRGIQFQTQTLDFDFGCVGYICIQHQTFTMPLVCSSTLYSKPNTNFDFRHRVQVTDVFSTKQSLWTWCAGNQWITSAGHQCIQHQMLTLTLVNVCRSLMYQAITLTLVGRSLIYTTPNSYPDFNVQAADLSNSKHSLYLRWMCAGHY